MDSHLSYIKSVLIELLEEEKDIISNIQSEEQLNSFIKTINHDILEQLQENLIESLRSFEPTTTDNHLYLPTDLSLLPDFNSLEDPYEP